MSVNEDMVETFEDAWLSFYGLEQEMLETQRAVRHYNRENGRVDEDDSDYGQEFGDYTEAQQDAEWRVERLLDEAENFYAAVDSLKESLGRNRTPTVSIIDTDGEERFVPIDWSIYEEDSVPKGVKGFQYDPDSSHDSYQGMVRGTLALMYRWGRLKDEVAEHFDPMVEEIDELEVGDESLESLSQELEQVEESVGRKAHTSV